MRATLTVCFLICCLSILNGITVQDILNGKDVIGYLYEGNLSLMDINTRQEFPIITNKQVESFCWDYSGNRIYYLLYDRDIALLSGYSMQFPDMQVTRLFEKKVKPIIGVDNASIELQKARIMLNTDWGVEVELGFGACYVTDVLQYVISRNPNSLKLAEGQRYKLFLSEYEAFPVSETEGKDALFITRTAEKFSELYYRQGRDSDSGMRSDPYIRLSKTQDIDRDPTFSMGEFDYSVAPDNKTVVFGFETFSGDLMHGVTMAVNLDGTSQQLLSRSCIPGNDFEFGWTSDNRLVYISDTDKAEIQELGYEDEYKTSVKLRDAQGNISVLKQFGTNIPTLRYRLRRPDLADKELSPAKDFSGLIYYQVKFDDMRIRENPSLTGRVLSTVGSPEELEYLGEKSVRTDSVTLRGVKYNSCWYKVRTQDNVSGWVYGAAIGK